MVATRIEPVQGPHVWRGADLAARRDWVHRLPGPALDQIGTVVREAAARGLGQDDFAFEAVEIPGLRQALAPAVQELAGGTGLALLRGLEIDRYAIEEELGRAAWRPFRRLVAVVAFGLACDVPHREGKEIAWGQRH